MKTYWTVTDRGFIVGHEERDVGDPNGGLTPIEDYSGGRAHTPRGERIVIAVAALLILAVCVGLLVEYGF